MSEMWVLSGIAVMVLGFVLRFYPLLGVVAAAAVTGLTAGLDLHAIVSAFGKAFNDTRYVSVVWIVLPVIGLLEAHGLQERARGLIAGLKGATTGRLLTGYLLIRQLSSALGLTSVVSLTCRAESHLFKSSDTRQPNSISSRTGSVV